MIKKTASKKEVRARTTGQLEVRRNADGSSSITGYAATFGDLSQDLGGFREKLQRGCFTRSLQTNPDVLMLFGHDENRVLGRTSSGTLQLEQDAKGLRFTCQLPNTSDAKDLAQLVTRGDIRGMSFGFRSDDDDWNDVDGQVIRTVLEATLFEISAVASPAYLSSSVSLRSAPAAIRAKLRDLDEDDTDNLEPDTDADAAADDAEDDDDLSCRCECRACQGGTCDDCDDDSCDDTDCEGCPMQDEARADRLRLSRHFESRRRNLCA